MAKREYEDGEIEKNRVGDSETPTEKLSKCGFLLVLFFLLLAAMKFKARVWLLWAVGYGLYMAQINVDENAVFFVINVLVHKHR